MSPFTGYLFGILTIFLVIFIWKTATIYNLSVKDAYNSTFCSISAASTTTTG